MFKKITILYTNLIYNLQTVQRNTIKKSKRSLVFSKPIKNIIQNNSDNISQCNRGKK